MGKVASTIGMVAGVVALSLAIPGVGTAIGLSAATASTVASVATAVSTVASAIGQQTQKPPDMRGSVSQVMIGANMAVPYVMGRTYVGGNMVYDDSSDGADNDERTQIFIGTAAGPIDSFENFLFDYTTITLPASGGRIEGEASGFYNNFLWVNSRLGLRPETALEAPAGATGTFRGWGASHILSGFAAWSVTMEFDEDGVRYASGIPAPGMVAKWVKVYDPRLDNTYPGGVGSHTWADEGTWEWSDNPALHALAYARGRFVNGVKVVGAGLAQEAVDLPAFVELANICEANGWTVGGAVYEGPGTSKWDNLKRILHAAAAEPVWVGGQLTLKIAAPKTSLDTITADDLSDGDIEVQAMTSWKDRLNTIVPRYRSEAHRWEYVQAEAVTSSTYVTEDGETKTEELQFDLCQDKDQAAQLAAYALVDRREFGPIRLNVKPRLMLYRPGEALTVDIPEAGLTGQLAVITGRTVDPATGSIQLTLQSETTAKHAFALGQTGVAPPTPTILTPEEIDQAVSDLSTTTAETTQLIATSYIIDADPLDGLLQATDTAITIEDHTRVYSDKQVAVTGGTISSLTAETTYHIYYDDPTRAGGAVTLNSTTVSTSAATSATNPGRHYVGSIKTDVIGGTGTSGGGATPPGWNETEWAQEP